MQEVNVYVKTTAHGPARKKRAYYAYVIQMLMPHKEYIRKGFGAMENVTENQITLTALVKAFERFNRGCRVRIFTSCEHVLHSAQNGWPWQWEKNSWTKSNGKTVSNAELWQQLLNVTKQHAISYTDEEHQFSSWMEFELKRMEQNNEKHNAEK